MISIYYINIHFTLFMVLIIYTHMHKQTHIYLEISIGYVTTNLVSAKDICQK